MPASPTGWEEWTLGELLDFSNGVNADKSAYGSGIPFANVFEIIANESLTENEVPGRIALPQTSAQRYLVKYGDVLFNRTSETPDEVGLSSVYVGNSSMLFGGFVIRGRPKTDRLSVSYLKYGLRVAYVRSQILARAQGAIRANVSQRDLRTVHVDLPPVAEQDAIASVLSDCDAYIDSLERLIAKKASIKLGMLQQLLTGNLRLRGFTRPWDHTKLGSVARMRSGGTPLSSQAKYYGGGIPWVSISDMTRGGKYISRTESTLTDDGLAASAAQLYDPDVVLYAMYASLGECSIAVGRVSSSQAILGITPGRELNREFLYYFLQFIKSRVKLLGQHGTQSNLNAGMVRDFDTPVPDLEEQIAIADSLSDADREIDVLRKRLAKAKAIKQGMAQQLLTGRVRLPAPDVVA